MKRFALALLLAITFAASACAKPAPEPKTWRRIDISAIPAGPNGAVEGGTFGTLTFRGGFRLVSSDAKFGGWSSIKMGSGGRLVAISDEGQWLSLRPDLDRNGALVGVSDTMMGKMRDRAGEPLEGKEASDAEGLARLPDGRFAVSFEQRHRVWYYDLDRNGPGASASVGPPIRGVGLRPNEGLESIVADRFGNLVVASETAPRDRDVPHFYRYRIGAAPARALVSEGDAEVSRGNSLVDMDMLPGGDFIALERFYLPAFGQRTAIRRYYTVGLDIERPTLTGPVLAAFATPQNIDNFEGIAAVPLPSGATRLYIISDDNFSTSQQTLLYAFDLAADPRPKR